MKTHKSLAGFTTGQRIENMRFPHNIAGTIVSVAISGRIEEIVETINAGWMTIRKDDGELTIVCLQ